MIYLKSIPAFGFEYENCHAGKSCEELEKSIRTAYWATNFFKALGYICPLVGAVRMIDALCSNDANKSMHFLRGLGELLGCGLFILGVDIVVTAYRASEAPVVGTLLI